MGPETVSQKGDPSRRIRQLVVRLVSGRFPDLAIFTKSRWDTREQNSNSIPQPVPIDGHLPLM